MTDEKIETIAIVPLRGIRLAKKRLRKETDDKKTNALVELLLENCLQELDKVATIKEIVLLTKERMLLEKKFTIKKSIRVMFDKRRSLNKALYESFLQLEKEAKNSHSERVLVVMPDVPALNYLTIETFLSAAKAQNLGLCPLETNGTTMIVFPIATAQRVKAKFGKNSLRRFQKMAKCKKIPYIIFTPKTSLQDIDCLTDALNWLDTNEANAKIILKKKMEKLLK